MTSTYFYVNGGLVKRLTTCLLGTTIRTQHLLKGFNFMADLDVLHSRTNPNQTSRLIPMQILINQKPNLLQLMLHLYNYIYKIFLLRYPVQKRIVEILFKWLQNRHHQWTIMEVFFWITNLIKLALVYCNTFTCRYGWFPLQTQHII